MPDARVIAHVDMDAFYASVELLRYPGLRGKPLVTRELSSGEVSRSRESLLRSDYVSFH